jgi:hypothetical protein
LSAVVSDDEYRRVDRLVRAGAARSIAELVRLAVGEYLTQVGANKLLSLREIPLPMARRAVEHYLKEHPGVVWPDEMAEKLGIDYRIVLSVVNQFLKEKRVEYATAKTEAIQV